MTDWFRVWHGAVTDPKWRTVARRAGSDVRPGDVWAIVSWLYDRASQATPRGSIAGFDVEVIEDALGYPADMVERVMAALHDKGVLAGGAVASWEKYQPKREDGAAERARAWREAQKAARQAAAAPSANDVRAHPNAPERTRTQTSDGERKRATDTESETDKKVVVVEAGARAALERFTVADGDRVADRLFLDVVPEGHALRTDPLAASVCIGWLRSNFDVERDIVPAVRKALAGSYPITKWRSLTTWVERVFADRLAAESARPPPVLVEQPATVIHPSQSGHRHGKSSVQDIAKLAHERALAAAAGDGEILPPPRRQPH